MLSLYHQNTALITGASSGIGEAFARELHARGMNLVLVARRAALLEELQRTLESVRPHSVEIIVADLCTSGLTEVAQYISSHKIDLLVNNAGRGSFNYFEEIDCDREREMVALNIQATLTLAHAIIPQLKQRKSGGIIALSSIAAFQPLPYMATYCATKAFNLFHSLALHFELKRFGVRVLSVCPGPVATEFGGVARIPGKMTGLPRSSPQDVVRESLRAYERNRLYVVPTLRAKAMWLLSLLLPWRWGTYLTERMLKSTLDVAK